MSQDPQPDRSTLGATLSLAAALATFAAAGALLPVATRLYALGAGGTARAGTALAAALAAGIVAGAWVTRRGPGRRGTALSPVVVSQCLVALALAAAPALHMAGRGVSLRLWPLLGGTPGGDWGLRLIDGLSLATLPAAAVAALLVSLAALVREGGGIEHGPAGAFSIGLAAAGMAIGVACGGMLLLPAVGMRSTFLVGLALSGIGAAAGVLCLRSAPRPGAAGSEADGTAVDETAPGPVPAGAAPATGLAWLTPAVAFLAGVGLATAAVAWSRVVALLAGPTEGAASAALGTILLGVGVGAFLAAGMPATLGAGAGAALLSLGAVAVFVSMHLVPTLATRVLILVPGAASSGGSVLLAVLVGAALAVPGSAAIGWGAVALVAGDRRPERGALSRMLAGFAAGAAVGSAMTICALIPALGLRRTLGAAAVAVALGAAGLAAAAPWQGLGQRLGAVAVPLGLAVAAWMFPAAWDPRVVAGAIYRYGASAPTRLGSVDKWLEERQRGAGPLFYREGSEAVVVVERTLQKPPGLDPIESTSLTVDGRSVAGTGTDMRTQVLTGALPMLLHGDTDRALLIELLSGVTAGSMLRHPLKALTVIEREPAVVEAAAVFADVANEPLADERLTVVHDDPRHRLLADRTRYDVIVLAAGDPWVPYAADLMTREGYAVLKSRLTERGLVARRLSLGAVTPAALPVLLRTFAGSFASVIVFQLTPDDLLLAGSDAPLLLDGGRLKSAVASDQGIAEDIGRAVIVGANEVMMTLRLDREALLKVAGQGPINDDDHAPVQRMAERDLAVQHNGPAAAAIDQAWPGFAPLLTGYGTNPAEKADFLYSLAKSYLGITTDPARALDLAHELEALGATAKARWVSGEARLQQKDVDGALGEWEAVLALEPDNIDALFSLGTFHLDARDDRAAERYLGRAAAAHPEVPVVAYHQGRALFNMGRYEQAITALRHARAIGAGSHPYPLVDYLVGISAARLGRDDEAVSSLKEYLTWAYAQDVLTRVEVDAHLKLADVLDHKGRRFDALQERQKAERLRQGIEEYGRLQQSSAGAPGGATGGAPPDANAPVPAVPPAPNPSPAAPPGTAPATPPGPSDPDGR